MSRVSGWKVVRAAVMGVVISPLSANVAQADSFSDSLKRANEVLQKLKPLEGSQSATSSNTPNNATVVNGSTDSDSAAPSTTATSKGTGPDIVGLRIGISPNEARSIIKSRPKQPNYGETPQTLAYKNSGSLPTQINGANYLAYITTWGRAPDNLYHKIAVAFSPVPGHEGMTWAYRKEEFDHTKRPTVEAFMKALTEKYGAPTRWDMQSLPNMPIWSYDGHGNLRPSGSLKDVTACLSYINTDSFSDPLAASVTPAHEQKCGSIALSVFFDFDGGSYAGPQTLITGYSSQLTGFSAVLEGEKSAAAIIDAAHAKDSSAAIKAGQQQRPEL